MAMFHCIFAICEHGCCLLCYKCTDSYIEKGGQLKWENSHVLRLVVCYTMTFGGDYGYKDGTESMILSAGAESRYDTLSVR